MNTPISDLMQRFEYFSEILLSNHQLKMVIFIYVLEVRIRVAETTRPSSIWSSTHRSDLVKNGVQDSFLILSFVIWPTVAQK
jgi:hypothetical protein